MTRPWHLDLLALTSQCRSAAEAVYLCLLCVFSTIQRGSLHRCLMSAQKLCEEEEEEEEEFIRQVLQQ